MLKSITRELGTFEKKQNAIIEICLWFSRETFNDVDLALSQGSVFITFTKKEDVEKFLAEPETKYEDAVLIKKSK